MSEWLTRLLNFWEFGALPLLLWWSLICTFVVAAIEIEHRIVDRKCVEHRASLWRMAAVLSLFFPLLIWLSPIALQVSIPSLRPVNNQLIHSWQARPVETNEIPDGAGLHVFDRGFNPSEIALADIEWTLPRWPSLRPVADLSLPPSWTVALLLIYGAGFLMYLCVQGYRKQRVRQFVWETSPCKSDDLVTLIEEKARAFDIKRKIDVRVYDGAISPCIVGGRRIVFVLPRSMTDSWSREELTPILIHELSHVRHGDLWYEWAVLKLKALLWFNPFVYWLAHRLDDTREALADAHALSYCGSAKEYAQLLVRLAESVIHYPGIQAAHPFAVPGKKTLRRLNRLKNVFADTGRSFADNGYLVRIAVWASFLLVIGGIHTAAPLVNMFSIVEPHPDTSKEALAYLREYRDWLNQYESGYSLSANVSQRFSASDPKTEKTILLMTRDARVHEWKNGSDFFRKDIYGTHEFFPPLFEEDRNNLIWTAFSYVESDGLCFKKYARDAFAPKRWIDADKHFIDPFQKDSPYEADWIETSAQKDNRSKDINFHNALVYCYYHNAPYITEMVECGERIATLERDGSSEIVTVAPTFGTGYKYVFTITPQSKPLPSRIEAWEEGRLVERKDLRYSDKKELLKLINTTNSTWKTDTSNRISFTIKCLEAKTPTDSSLFETPELTQTKAPSVAFPTEEALCFLNSSRTFDRETWTPIHPLDLSPEAYLEGYFYREITNGGTTYGGGVLLNGKTVEGSLSAFESRVNEITFHRTPNCLDGRVKTTYFRLNGAFELSGQLKKTLSCAKLISSCTYSLERPGFEPYLDWYRDGLDIGSGDISPEEYFVVSNELFQQFGFFQRNDDGDFFTKAYAGGRLGETPKAELALYNFGDTDIVVQSFNADPLVQVELPPDRIIPARSRTVIHFQAPAGIDRRSYLVTLKLDHPVVKRLDVGVNVWAKA